jgi:enamine deaminase RidA (YjgF/YER057c/UK114 family)
MIMRHIVPRGVRPTTARYSHGVEIPPHYRIVVCSGQPGSATGNRVPSTIEEQTHLCFKNIREVLEAADMSFVDVVGVRAAVASRVYVKGFLSVRDQYIQNPPPASTLAIVLGFADPEFLVEVEVIAAGRE